MKALRMMKDNDIPFFQTTHELLSLAIFVEEEVTERNKNHLQKKMLRKVNDYLDDLIRFEGKMTEDCSR